jgi:uncharacterized protein
VGVPMSTSTTGAAQRARLRALGLATRSLQSLRDVDDIEDAVAVAHDAPWGRFAGTLRMMLPQLRGRIATLAVP